MVVTLIYSVMYITALGLFLYLIKTKEYVNATYFVLATTLSIMSAGSLIETTAKTLRVALFGFRLSHIGLAAIPMMLLYIASRLCHVQFARWIWMIEGALSSVVMGLSLSIQHSKIYYSDAYLFVSEGYSRIITVNGPLHFLVWVNVAFIGALALYLIVQAKKNEKKVPKRLVNSLVVILLIMLILSLIDLISTSVVEVANFAPVIAMGIVMYILSFIELHDINDCIACVSGNVSEAAYIVFDRNKRYINATEGAKKIFPVIRNLKVDRKIPESDTDFYREIVRFLDDSEENKSKLLEISNNYYAVKKSTVKLGNVDMLKSGYLVEFLDVTANNSYLTELNKYNKQLEVEIEEKEKDIVNLQERLVLGMATIVESRDNTTGEHIVRTSRVVKIFSEELLKDSTYADPDFMEKVVRAVPMHDLGKIAVDDKVLRKTGKYDEHDFAEMRKHPAEGARIVRKILAGNEEQVFAGVAANIANYHHERWDGTGYPERLKGEEIPLEARIMSLADALDGIISERESQWPRNFEESFEIIEENLGSQFDPVLGKKFVENKKAFEVVYAPLGKA